MPSPGDKISHYKVISAIGKGGMGEVYLAVDTRLERQVALKILPGDVAADDDRVRRFVQEAKAASALNHPNILTVYEIGEFEHSRYIATEFIQGETLRDRMRDESIGLTEAIGIAMQTAGSLSAAHEAGILHRDIKPENIMIRNDGLVKVLDFGLAKLTETTASASASEDSTRHQVDTQPGMILGTVAYMSPEQVRGKQLDARSDIFSLGSVMYELFTGTFPFEGEGHVDLASSILKDDPRPLRQLAPNLPQQLERIVDKALRKDRDKRYQHIKDLQIDLQDLNDELKFEAKQNKTADQRLPTIAMQRLTLSESISTTRRFTLLHALLFAAGALAVIGAVIYFRPGFGVRDRVPGSYKTAEIAAWNSAAGELYSSARFSPDGKMIAFASTKSGSKNIWVTQTGSTAAIQVTNDAFANTDPVWSPKGDEIAYFVAGRRTGGDANASGIWRVPALGGAPRLIAPLPDASSRIRRWGASGKIYYTSGDGVYAVDTGSGIPQKITSLDQGQLAWMDVSVDERSLAIAIQNNDAWRITTMTISGTGATEIAAGPGKAGTAAWLSDKNRLFYTAATEGVMQAFVTNVGSGHSQQITAGETDTSVVDASPDGKTIIVASAKEESNLWRVGVVDSQEAPVSRDINSKIFPAVAPANDKVAFQSYKNLSQGNNLLETAVVVKNLKASSNDAEGPAQLAEHGFLPAWSPDGSSIIFLTGNDSAYDMSLVNANGGGSRKLAQGVVTDGFSVSPYNYTQTQAFGWSPDGQRIVYISKKSGAANLWAVRPADGEDTMLTDNSDPRVLFFCPVWSLDGKRLAYAAGTNNGDNSEFKYLDIGSAEAAEVYQATSSIRRFRLLGWTSDGSGFIIAERAATSGLPPETTLKRVDLASHAETVIATLKNAYFYNIFLSDDRKSIAFAARNDDRDDIWTIPATGGTPRRLTANNDSGLYYSRLAWLHDGSAIVFGKQTRFSLLSMITDID